MTLHRLVFPATALSATLFAAALACTAAHAAQTADAIEAQTRHLQEVAVCNSGASPEGRKTCLYEAQSAYAQDKRNGLTVNGADYATNSAARCQALQGSDRSACLTRMQGGGTVSGSVAGGGVLRELVMRTSVAPTDTAAQPAEPR